jgi:flagella basal body P-ring formation protein FlgA
MTLKRLALIAAAILAATPVLAGPTLRAEVSVASDIVTLGDLVEGAGPAAATPVFRAPPLGKAGTIQAIRIEEAARAAGVTGIDLAGLSQVVVTRAGRRLAKSEIEDAVRESLRLRHGMDHPDLSLAFDPDAAFVVEPEAGTSLKVTELAYDPKTRRVDVTLVVPGSRATALKPIRLTGQVLDMVDVPVLATDLQRGDEVKAADIRMERRPRAELPAGGFADPAVVAGRAARTALRAGSLLREQDLVRQELVEKNSLVLVVYETPGVSLSMRGKALEGGAMGDVVSVLNIQSKRTVQATVTGRARVTVSFATPGPMAAAGTPAKAE